MGKLAFSVKSLKKINTCHDKLKRVIHRALSYDVMDFTVIYGARATEEQVMLHKLGRSEKDGIFQFSKHQIGGGTGRKLSEAVDLAPYPVDWDNTMSFHILAGIMLVAAKEENVKLRWGGDWDGDFSNADQNFNDLGHFELIEG